MTYQRNFSLCLSYKLVNKYLVLTRGGRAGTPVRCYDRVPRWPGLGLGIPAFSLPTSSMNTRKASCRNLQQAYCPRHNLSKCHPFPGGGRELPPSSVDGGTPSSPNRGWYPPSSPVRSGSTTIRKDGVPPIGKDGVPYWERWIGYPLSGRMGYPCLE